MTNLTCLRLILVDLSGLMKKRIHVKQNVLFFNHWCGMVFLIFLIEQRVPLVSTTLKFILFENTASCQPKFLFYLLLLFHCFYYCYYYYYL